MQLYALGNSVRVLMGSAERRMALGAAMPVGHCGVWHAGCGHAGLGTHLDGRLAPRPPERRQRDMGFWLGSKKCFSRGRRMSQLMGHPDCVPDIPGMEYPTFNLKCINRGKQPTL